MDAPTLGAVDDRTWDFVLAEVQRARQERIARFESQDSKLGVLFALSGVLIALSAALPWHVGIACVMFSAFAAYYASDGLRTRPVDTRQRRVGIQAARS